MTQNGISPNLYPTYIGKATKIETLASKEQVVLEQNLKVANENTALMGANERLKEENHHLKETNDWLQDEGDRLKLKNEEFAKINNARAGLSDLRCQIGQAVNTIADLYEERDHLEKTVTRLNDEVSLLRTDSEDLYRELIEEVESNVIDAIRHVSTKTQSLAGCDLLNERHDFGRILHHHLEEPIREFFASLMDMPREAKI